MLNYLENLDQRIFLFLNSFHCSLMDHAMWYISGRPIWIPLYAIIIYFIIRKRKRNFWLTLIAVALMIFLSDQIADVIKDTVHRLRPSHNPTISNLVHVVIDPKGHEYRGGSYGFVSSHASNCFAVFAFVSMFFAKRWVTIAMCFWALLVVYSRIYLGVHYPGDILGGAIIGLAIGSAIFSLENLVFKKYFDTPVVEQIQNTGS
jgi:undecaprenyl-diphosphatase